MPTGMNNETAFIKLGYAPAQGRNERLKYHRLNHGPSNAATRMGRGNRLSGRVTAFSDFNVAMKMDESSPSLAAGCATKRAVSCKAETALVSGKDVLKLTLEDVIITSVSVAFRSGET